MSTMTIDNFATIRSHLRFDNPGDIYVFHIIIRGKDIDAAQKKMFREDHQSGLLLKTYYIDSLDYFDKKVPAMIDLANANHARVYAMMTRKNRITVNRILAKKIIDFIDDPNVRYDHLIRSATCGCHVSDLKWWTIDIDRDEKIVWKDGKEHVLWDIVNDITNDITQLVHEAKTRDYPEDLFCVPTRNGCHIMCAPFNRSKYPWLGKRIMSDAMTLAYMPG